MPLISIRKHGFTVGPDRSDYQMKKTTHGLTSTVRGACAGWSAQAMRNNERFLQSIDFEAIRASVVFAVTVTLRDPPDTPAEFKRLLDVYLKWLRREGFGLYHWVVEWALRTRHEGGSPVPHLHLLIFNTSGTLCTSDGYILSFEIPDRWVKLTAHLGTQSYAQHIARVEDVLGWSKYVAKHSARHNAHAQRQQVLPEKWEKPGRMWGHSRGFPLVGEHFNLDTDTFHVFRRVVLRYLISNEKMRRRKLFSLRKHRQSTARISYLKRYLQKRREVSEKMTVGDWVDITVTVRLLDYAMRATERDYDDAGARG